MHKIFHHKIALPEISKITKALRALIKDYFGLYYIWEAQKVLGIYKIIKYKTMVHVRLRNICSPVANISDLPKENELEQIHDYPSKQRTIMVRIHL